MPLNWFKRLRILESSHEGAAQKVASVSATADEDAGEYELSDDEAWNVSRAERRGVVQAEMCESPLRDARNEWHFDEIELGMRGFVEVAVEVEDEDAVAAAADVEAFDDPVRG